MTPAVKDRLAELDDLVLNHGGHGSFEEGHCATELVSYLADEPFSDHPKCMSPVLGAFLRRLNDGLGDEERQLLKPYLPRCIDTAGDGQDEARAVMAADWVIHTSLPIWCELAGAEKTAKELRELPPFTTETRPELRKIVRRVRDEMYELRGDWRERIREAVRAELKKRGLDKAAAAADAVAVAVAVAAAAADAAADAVAVAVAVAAAAADAAADAAAVAVAAAAADAVAVAAAAADAVAVAVAVAAAAAAADAVADRWGTVYRAVYKAVKDRYREVFAEKFKPQTEALLPSALELLDRMIDPKAAS